jgi:hypothetical protein
MAGSTRQSREHKKWLLARRTQFRLKQQLDYIDFVEDVLEPESEALLSGKVALEIEPISQDAAQSIINVTIRDETTEAPEGDFDIDAPSTEDSES